MKAKTYLINCNCPQRLGTAKTVIVQMRKKSNLLNVRKLLLLAKQTQVHAEKMRGAGIEVTQNYTTKPEMPPVTFVGILCKIRAVLCSKIADVGLENWFTFGKFSDFYCITPET